LAPKEVGFRAQVSFFREKSVFDGAAKSGKSHNQLFSFFLLLLLLWKLAKNCRAD
jgi:hypothetical protein